MLASVHQSISRPIFNVISILWHLVAVVWRTGVIINFFRLYWRTMWMI